jgi:tRNA (adenine37-N6)-methyltransferase
MFHEETMDEIIYSPIGIVHTEFNDIEGAPIQPIGAKGCEGKIEIFPEFVGGLKDLDGFSHILIIYHFHLSKGHSLEVIPFMDDTLRGVFATRAPKRPNPIGVSVVRLMGIRDNVIFIQDVDVVNGTPLLDIKPFVDSLDNRESTKNGWLSNKAIRARQCRSDGRFK